MTEAEAVLALVLDRSTTLGDGRLLCLDGPSGSGKSELARAIERLTPATVVHTDDLCPGWDGLPRVPAILASLLAPLSDGRPGTCPRYDWTLGAAAEEIVVEPTELLVVEGLGAGARLLREWRTGLVWLDADPAVRRERALARDGDHFRDFWDHWARAEETYFAEASDRARADLVVTT